MAKGSVLISGSAGGIGSATAERFLAGGYEVLGVDLADHEQPDPGFRSAVADVTDTAALCTAVDELAGDGPITHVAAIAGRVVPEELVRLDSDPVAAVTGFEASLALNLTGQFALIAAALDGLRRADGDRSITLCSSINALGDFGVPAYSAAKAGLMGLMHSLAGPLGDQGIRVNAVAPGTIRTPLTESEAAAAGDRRRFERAAASSHIKRVGMPDDVAAAVYALATELTHVTDEVMRVDGGQLRANPS